MSWCENCSPPNQKGTLIEDKPEKKHSTSREIDTLSRIASSANLSSIASMPEYDIDSTISVAEIRKNISNLVKSKGADLIRACKTFDKANTNKMTRTQLRQVLRMFCFPISAVQFDSLCEDLKVSNSLKIGYKEFFTEIGEVKKIEFSKPNDDIPDNFPIDELELRIKEKIAPNLYNVIRSFWLFDLNKDGFIQKKELRRILKSYCFNVPENLYNELWKSYDPKGTGSANYQKILNRIGINADRYKKYMPPEMAANFLSAVDNMSQAHVYDRMTEQKTRRAAQENRDDPMIQGLPIDEIVMIFLERLQCRYPLLKKTFKLFDYESNGLISVADFHALMNYFVVATSTKMFNEILERLNVDIPPTNKLCFEDCLKKFFKSKKPMKQTKSTKLDCFPVIQRIKNNVLNPGARLLSVFTKKSKGTEWEITREELRRAIEMGLNFNLSTEEFKELTTLLDPGNTNIINCKNFLELFESNQGDKKAELTDSSQDDCNEPRHKISEKYRDLRGEKLKSKLKHYLNKNIVDIERTLLVCDMNQSSRISCQRLKEILDLYCFPMTLDQFNDAIKDLRIYGDSLNYNEFLEMFKKKPNEDISKWVAAVDKLVKFKSRCDPALPMNEVEEIVRDCVGTKHKKMLQDFKALDICNVGVSYKEDFRSILNKYVFRLNDKQFKQLWKLVPVNNFGQLIYDKFIEEFSQPAKKSTVKIDTALQETQETSSSDFKREDEEVKSSPVPTEKSQAVSSAHTLHSNDSNKIMNRSTNRSKIAKEKACCNAPHLKKIFDAMEPSIVKNFRTIRHHLRRIDPKLTGIVDFTLFKPILAHCGINLSEEEIFHILEYFDGSLTGKINYRDFLRIFVWYA